LPASSSIAGLGTHDARRSPVSVTERRASADRSAGAIPGRRRETSCAQPSSGLKPKTPIGFLYWPSRRCLDDGFEVGMLDVGFAPDPALPAEIVHHQVDVLIVAVRHDRGRPIGPTHYKLHATEPGDSKPGSGDSFLGFRLNPFRVEEASKGEEGRQELQTTCDARSDVGQNKRPYMQAAFVPMYGGRRWNHSSNISAPRARQSPVINRVAIGTRCVSSATVNSAQAR
jgi:hypothetical protein